MDKKGVWSTFSARPGLEAEVEAFLAQCRDAIAREPGTTTFVAMKIGPGRYATFDTMRDETAFEAHVAGPTADAVRARAAELFTAAPDIVVGEVLVQKLPTGEGR